MKTTRVILSCVVCFAGIVACNSDATHDLDAARDADVTHDSDAARDSDVPPATHVPSECRIDCKPGVPCGNIPFAKFPTFSVTRTEWRKLCDTELFVAAGTCDDGTLVLHHGNGVVGELRFYDANGKFRGLIETTDGCGPVCKCGTYWPDIVDCEHSVTTEVLCGSGKIGTPIYENPWEYE